MFKRLFALVLLGSALAAPFAQETTTKMGPVLSGVFSAGFANGNLLSDPFVEGTPGFSSGYPDAAVELRLSALALTSVTDTTLYKGILSATRRVGYEAGLVLDLADLLGVTGATYEEDSNADTSGYPMIQRMVDWYEDNAARYGLASNPFGSSWPTTSYGSSGGRYRFIHGATVEPIEWVSWTQAKWADAQALYTDIHYAILTEIEAISDDFTSGSGEHVNQFSFSALSASRQAAVLAEQEAYDGFLEFVEGHDSSLSIDGVVIQKAWVTFRNIGGLLDARLDLSGATLYAGRLVRSPRAGQSESGAAVAVSLAPGFVPGLSASLSANLAGGLSTVAEDWNTKSMDWYPGEPAWFGTRLSAAYDFYAMTGLDLVVGLDAVLPDLAARPGNVAFSLSAAYELAGPLSMDAAAEVDVLLWTDRYVPSRSAFGFAAAVDAEGDYLGAGLRLRTAFKTAGYGGDGGNLADDRFDGNELWDDFDAAALGMALGFDGGLFFDPTAILGMDLGRVEAGARLFVYGADTVALQGLGWYAGLAFRMLDLTGLPLTIAASYDRYRNDGLVTYADAAGWPTAGFLADSTWGLSLTWDPTDSISVAVRLEDAESGYKVDTYRVMSLGAWATVKF